MIVPMCGIIASCSYAANAARRQRERDETSRECRNKGITCANCCKICDKRGQGNKE